MKRYHAVHSVCPKPLKPVISKEIFDKLQKLNPPARFLKSINNGQSNNDNWYEISYKEASNKIRHALRDYDARMSKRGRLFTEKNVLQQAAVNHAFQVHERNNQRRDFSLLQCNHPLLLNVIAHI